MQLLWHHQIYWSCRQLCFSSPKSCIFTPKVASSEFSGHAKTTLQIKNAFRNLLKQDSNKNKLHKQNTFCDYFEQNKFTSSTEGGPLTVMCNHTLFVFRNTEKYDLNTPWKWPETLVRLNKHIRWQPNAGHHICITEIVWVKFDILTVTDRCTCK